MTSLYREPVLNTDAARAWRALRDPANAAHAFAGVLVDCTLDGGTRAVTFATGDVIQERIVAIDEARMQIACTVLGGRFEHQHASMQIVPEGPSRCRFVWQNDFLPDARRDMVEPLMNGMRVAPRLRGMSRAEYASALRPALSGSGCRLRSLDSPVSVIEPVFAEHFDGMRRTLGPVSATERIGRTIAVTPPADALGMLGIDGDGAGHEIRNIAFRQ